jgi:hypothetical protein
MDYLTSILHEKESLMICACFLYIPSHLLIFLACLTVLVADDKVSFLHFCSVSNYELNVHFNMIQYFKIFILSLCFDIALYPLGNMLEKG